MTRLHPCCPNEELRIDGLWMVKNAYYGVAWTCPVYPPCGTSSGTLWHLAPAWMRAEAIEKDMRAKREAGP